MKASFLISEINLYWKWKVICSSQKRAILVKRCSAIHGLDNFTLVRNKHSAGSSVFRCREGCRLSCGWWELEERGHEPVPTLYITKGLGTQPGDQTLRHSRSLSQTATPSDCKGIKAQVFLCLRSILRGIQIKPLVFCWTIINFKDQNNCSGKLLFSGKPEVKPVRKSGLTVSVGCVGSRKTPKLAQQES